MRVKCICVHCSKSFIAKRSATQYCSSICYKREYRKKQKESNSQIVKPPKIKTVSIPLSREELYSKPYLNIKEAIVLFGISDSTIRKLIKDKTLLTIRIGKKHIIRKSDLDKSFKILL